MTKTFTHTSSTFQYQFLTSPKNMVTLKGILESKPILFLLLVCVYLIAWSDSLWVGRIFTKRASGSSLVFYDIRSEGAKLQLLCDRRAYTTEEQFDKIHALLRRGDIVGV